MVTIALVGLLSSEETRENLDYKKTLWPLSVHPPLDTQAVWLFLPPSLSDYFLGSCGGGSS
jgi:hypothetical protein